MRKFIHLLILISSVFLVNCTGLTEDYNEVNYNNPIRIGFLGPFSTNRGPTEAEYLGMHLAAEEINATGGILGREVQIIARDDAGSAEVGIKEATQLYNEGIRIIVGPDWSSVTLAVAKEVTIPKEMLLMSFSATNPDISLLADNDLVWRTCPSDLFQGKIGAVYCKNYLHKQSAAILALNNPYSLELAKAFQQNFTNLGGTITHFGIYPELSAGEAAKYDYTKHLDSLFNTQPEVFYLVAYPEDGSKITNDIAKNHYITNNYNPVLFTNDGLHSIRFLENGNIDVINEFIGTAPGTAKTNPNFNVFFKKFISQWGYEPAPYAEYAYDAIYLIAYSILCNNGSPKPLEIAPFLREISGTGNSGAATIINVNEFSKARDIIVGGGKIDYNGASGKIEFDQNGDPSSGTYLIWRVENNVFVTDTIVNFP